MGRESHWKSDRERFKRKESLRNRKRIEKGGEGGLRQKFEPILSSMGSVFEGEGDGMVAPSIAILWRHAFFLFSQETWP